MPPPIPVLEVESKTLCMLDRCFSPYFDLEMNIWGYIFRGFLIAEFMDLRLGNTDFGSVSMYAVLR